MTTSLRPDRLPTLEDLIAEQEKQGHEFKNTPNELQNIIDLLNEVPEFYQYAYEHYGSDSFDLPYVTYCYLMDYLGVMYEAWDFHMVRRIFLFIEKKRKEDNEYTKNLIGIECILWLESHKKYMPEIFEYMPTDIKLMMLRTMSDSTFYEMMGRLRRPGEFGSS